MATIRPLNNYVFSIEDSMVRSFVIIGETKAILLDTGVDHSPFLELIPQMTDKPIMLVNTHADPDHISQNNLFTEGYASALEIDILNQKESSKNVRYYAIVEGYKFDLGNLTLEVIDIPGHTPGSIGLLNRATGDFFSGDMISLEPIYMFGERRDLHTFLVSQQKMLSISEIVSAFPCHGQCPLNNPHDINQQLIDLTQQILNHNSTFEQVEKTFGNHTVILKKHHLKEVSIYTL